MLINTNGEFPFISKLINDQLVKLISYGELNQFKYYWGMMT